MTNSLPIGTIVELKIECLGNPIGTRGICYEVYRLDKPGSSFIFENGNYCGFSIDEQDQFFRVIKEGHLDYSFTNVIQLSKDFNIGVFDVMRV